MNQLVKEINQAISKRFNFDCNGNSFEEIEEIMKANIPDIDGYSVEDVKYTVYGPSLFAYSTDKDLVKEAFEKTKNFELWYGDNCVTYDDISFLDDYNEDFEIGNEPCELYPILFEFANKKKYEIGFSVDCFDMASEYNGVIKPNFEVCFEKHIDFNFQNDYMFVRYVFLYFDFFVTLDDDKFRITFGKNED